VLTFTSKLHALSDIFCSPLLTLTHIKAGRNVISCPHMIQMKFLLWSYPLVQSVNVVNDQAPSTQLLPCILLSSCSALITQVYNGQWHSIRKSKISSVFWMGSENVLDFVHVYQRFQFSELCREEWKKL